MSDLQFRSTIIDELTERGLVPQVEPKPECSQFESPCRVCVFKRPGGYQGIDCIEVPCDGVVWMRKEDAQ